jgi:hypothetical protein
MSKRHVVILALVTVMALSAAFAAVPVNNPAPAAQEDETVAMVIFDLGIDGRPDVCYPPDAPGCGGG